MSKIPVGRAEAQEIAVTTHLSNTGYARGKDPDVKFIKKAELRVQHFVIGEEASPHKIVLNLAGEHGQFWEHPILKIVHNASCAMFGGEKHGFIFLVNESHYFVDEEGCLYHYLPGA